MKIKITFKNPDAISEALRDIEDENQQEQLRDEIGAYVKYGEYVTLEFDTVTKEMTVKKV